MTLEHYPGHDRAAARRVEAEARRRWPLQDSLIVHRVGRMLPGEPIVLVATASAHRRAALDACAFLIDWLKTEAPFWKLEETPEASAGSRPGRGRCRARAWQSNRGDRRPRPEAVSPGEPVTGHLEPCRLLLARGSLPRLIELHRGFGAEQDLDRCAPDRASRHRLVCGPAARRARMASCKAGRNRLSRLSGVAARPSLAPAMPSRRVWRAVSSSSSTPSSLSPSGRVEASSWPRISPCTAVSIPLPTKAETERRISPAPPCRSGSPASCRRAPRDRPRVAGYPRHRRAPRRAAERQAARRSRACRRCDGRRSGRAAASRSRSGSPISAPRSGSRTTSGEARASAGARAPTAAPAHPAVAAARSRSSSRSARGVPRPADRPRRQLPDVGTTVGPSASSGQSQRTGVTLLRFGCRHARRGENVGRRGPERGADLAHDLARHHRCARRALDRCCAVGRRQAG